MGNGGAPESTGPHEISVGSEHFVCNICGARNRVPGEGFGRESISCSCGSIVRWRSVVAALSVALFDVPLVLAEFPRCPHRKGIGMSDWPGYGDPLGALFDYTNTFYERSPYLDIMAEVPAEMAGTCDFVISSDVLEHVPPPYETALVHLRQLLRPGGHLILTVPLKPTGRSEEHFPRLHRFEIEERDGRMVVVNQTASGDIETYDQLVFHEGPGLTLEMRLLSAPDLIAALVAAGFEDVEPFDRTIPEHGVVWDRPWSWPVVARAPARNGLSA